MAEVIKRLGATTVSAGTNTALYVVPVSTSAVISTVAVCNRSGTSATFRIAVIDGAIGTIANEDYIYYDVPISANDTFTATMGVTMAASNTLMVRSNSTQVNFICFGTEIS